MWIPFTALLMIQIFLYWVGWQICSKFQLAWRLFCVVLLAICAFYFLSVGVEHNHTSYSGTQKVCGIPLLFSTMVHFVAWLFLAGIAQILLHAFGLYLYSRKLVKQ